jgi:uncharacterized protein (TIGR03067 family)
MRTGHRFLVAALVLLTVGIAFADDAKEAAIRSDRNKIKGTWRIVKLVADGNEVREEEARKLTVVNGSDGTWSLWSEGQELTKGTSTFDPTTTPKSLDFTPTVGDSAGKQYVGIYELGENTRKMCFAAIENGRPRDFVSTPGSGMICLTFERVESR